MPKKWTNPDGSRMTCQRPDCEDEILTQGMCKTCYNHMYYVSVTVGRKRNVKRNFD